MDIYNYIRQDHRNVAALMDELLSINLSAVQERIFHKLRVELSLHAEAEEQTFYKALHEASERAGMEDRIVHAREDHDEIRDLLTFLVNESVAGPRWMEKFGELKHAIEHHVKEEEVEIFAKARRLLSDDDAKHLAREMAIVKQRIRVPENEPTL
jgi:hemerythrin superfamily protein